MQHSIRSATQDDYGNIIELFRQTEKLHVTKGPDFFAVATTEDVDKVFDKFFSDSSVNNLVLEYNGAVRGYLRYRITTFPDVSFLARRAEMRCYIEEVVIDESTRRLGLGKAMLQYLEQLMKSEGIGFIHVHVFNFNRGAAALYDDLGFKPLTTELCKDLKS